MLPKCHRNDDITNSKQECKKQQNVVIKLTCSAEPALFNAIQEPDEDMGIVAIGGYSTQLTSDGRGQTLVKKQSRDVLENAC